MNLFCLLNKTFKCQSASAFRAPIASEMVTGALEENSMLFTEYREFFSGINVGYAGVIIAIAVNLPCSLNKFVRCYASHCLNPPYPFP